jgi:hypothetical protein
VRLFDKFCIPMLAVGLLVWARTPLAPMPCATESITGGGLPEIAVAVAVRRGLPGGAT